MSKMMADFKTGLDSIRDEIQKIKDMGVTEKEIKRALREALDIKTEQLAKQGKSIPSPNKVFEDAIKTTLTHPLVKRFMSHAKGNSENAQKIISEYYITEPWMAQAERIASTASIASPEMSLFPGQEITGISDEMENFVKSMIIAQMQESQVYLFTSEIVSKLDSMPIPRHTVSPDLMPYPVMYWTFEHPLKVSTDPKAESIEDMDWILLAESIDKIMMITNVGKKLLQRPLELGKIWPDDFERPEEWKLILSAFAFLNSPFVESNPVRLPRSSRRELERAAKKNPGLSPDPLTNVVMLRTLSDNGTSSNQDSSMEHDHQWWVSGHIRAQWYPSKNSHKLIWIAPHLKGPSDKPIKEKTYVVKR